MSLIVSCMIVLTIAHALYIRYMPVRRLEEIEYADVAGQKEMLDVREYNTDGYLIEGSTHIPYAYLPRFHHSLGQKPLHLLVENRTDLNMSVRFLRKKGYSVSSYTIIQQRRKANGMTYKEA